MSVDDRNYVTGYLDMRTRMGWQRRWCELRAETCTFSRSHEKKDMSKSKPINLKNVVVYMISESKSGKRFLIDHSDGIEMKAESPAVAQQWVQQIHRVQELHGVRPAESPDVVPRDYEDFKRILAEKNAEIAALKHEVERLRSQYGAEPEPAQDLPLVMDRLHNKIHRAQTHAQMEALNTDSSDDDDDLFEDAAQVFAVQNDWSDEEEERPRVDSFRGGERPMLHGSAGGTVAAPAVSPVPEAEQEWLGPPGAPCVGLKETCHKVPQMDIEAMPPNSCCDSWAELWNLRVGPNYKRTGKKGPSPPALYEFIGLECYETPNPCSNITKYLRIPKVDFETNGLPPVVCLNLQQPNCENPSMWSQQLDGPTLNMAYFWRIKKETADAAANLETAHPSVRLFAQYVREAPTFTGEDAGFRGRLKMMIKADKGLPKMFERYNGKPTLMTKSSRIVQGPGYFEMDCNIRVWCYPARAGIYSMWDGIPKIKIHCCITIEARADEEMNEVALGVCQMGEVQMEGCKPLPGFIDDNNGGNF